jgi:hypothetical protein
MQCIIVKGKLNCQSEDLVLIMDLFHSLFGHIVQPIEFFHYCSVWLSLCENVFAVCNLDPKESPVVFAVPVTIIVPGLCK